MYADDFLFNGRQASDFNLVISDDNAGEGALASGGDVEITSVRPPAKDPFDFYVGAFDNPVQYSFSVVKVNCTDKNDIYVTPEEESRIANWLIGDSKVNGYGWLQFAQDGYRDVCYKVVFTSMIPIQIAGRTIGFELSCTSNCGYAFSYLKTREFHISAAESREIIVSSDINTYIYPHIKIIGGSGTYTIRNNNDSQLATEITSSTTVNLDCENDIVETGITDPNNFNWIFPRLRQGSNVIATNSVDTLNIELTYREPRRIMV